MVNPSNHTNSDSRTTKHDKNVKGKPVNSIPKQFGRYHIERALGQGGMGAVYLAHDAQLDRKVAIKTPKFTEKSSPVLIQRFYREARSAATLLHPNICPVYDVGEINGIHYISMAYIEGRPLSDSMKSKEHPPTANVVRVIRKVALALHEAHSLGLVHRDLKPANIMIDRRGEPIVMDFGLATQFGTDEIEQPANGIVAPDVGQQKAEARLTMEGTVVGSPGYMSPEQLCGDPKLLGPAADVYSLGVVLYELLTRQLPFPGDGSLMSVINAVMSDPPPNASHVRREIEPRFAEICQKAMAKNIDDRYASMQTLAMTLTNALKADSGEVTSEEKPTGRLSPELVRTREQYELARSLFQESQFAAAASIMEKMAANAPPEPNQYTTWAQQKLPQARAKAEEGLLDGAESTDDLWGDNTPSSSTTNVRTKQKLRTKKRPGRWKKKTGLPTWAYRLVVGATSVIVLLVLAAVAQTLIAKFITDKPATKASTSDPKTPWKEPDTSTAQTEADSANKRRRPALRNADQPGLSLRERLLRLDANADGLLTREELSGDDFPNAGPLRRLIDKFDRFDSEPQDGKLDSNEIDKVAELLGRPNSAGK